MFCASADHAEARFYDPGVGDPYKSDAKVQMQYNIVRPLPPPKQSTFVTYRVNQETMHKFAQRARAFALPPEREIETGRGQRLAEIFNLFLNPVEHLREFKKEKIELAKVGKPPANPDFVAAERHEKRALLLFDLLEGKSRHTATTLWKFANLKDSPAELKRRDALFAAIAAQRQNWDNVSFMAIQHAIDNGLGQYELPKTNASPARALAANEKAAEAAAKAEAKQKLALEAKNAEIFYYTNLLLKTASAMKDDDNIDLIIDRVDPKMIAKMETDPGLDKIVFAIAKKRFATNEKALEILEKRLSPNSPLAEKMQLLRGLGYIENRKHKDALQILKHLASSEDPEINEKARVNLARLLAIFSQYDQALNIYRSLSIDSLARLDSLIEIAWLEFENGQYQYSLGKSIGLQTKFYYHAFLPEIYLLEAYSRKNMCDFGGAQAAIAQFKQDYTREIRQLRDLVRHKVEDKNYSMYAQLKDAFRNQDKERIRRYERFLLQVPAINNMQGTLYGLQKEHEFLVNEPLAEPVKADPVYMEEREFLNASLHKFYLKTKTQFDPVFEQVIYDELKYLDRKLLAIFQQVEYLQLDISASADMNASLQAAMNYPEIPEQEEEDIPASKARWPFEDNEYWEDEIAWLKSKNPSKCVPKSNDEQDNTMAAIQ